MSKPTDGELKYAWAVPSILAAARYHNHRVDRGHGNCLRLSKTTDTVAGAVGGGLLGKVALRSIVN